jgi:putative ABC transport system ATP-binding protein
VVPRFVLSSGEFVALVGESGCGKSTLLDMLALVLRPTACEVFRLFVDRRPVDVKALWERDDEAELARLRRRNLGYVLQSGGLLPFLSVARNIALPMRMKGMLAVDYRLNALAERMGVTDLIGKKPQFLSGGQRQRVAILRAMAHEPRMILADEPTAAVDQARARSIVTDFHALAREHQACIVMVTHDRALIDSVADRVYSYEVSQVSEGLTRSVCVPLH